MFAGGAEFGQAVETLEIFAVQVLAALAELRQLLDEVALAVLGRAERRARCAELLEGLRLTHVAKQKAYTLSGGERRKLEIARALVRRPTILMLDEPFSGVDPLAVHDIQQIVIGLKSQGLGIIITDHNVRETLAVVDRAYLIYEGTVLREGSSDFLVNDPEARKLYLGDGFRM